MDGTADGTLAQAGVPDLDVVAPAIPVAQAIGRLGNGFDQEILGRPTDLLWAVRSI